MDIQTIGKTRHTISMGRQIPFSFFLANHLLIQWGHWRPGDPTTVGLVVWLLE
jgi:hypothetical protein